MGTITAVNPVESLRIASTALSGNRVRSLLAMLGVIIGVAAVILLIAVGTGVKDEITGQIEGLGSNLIFVIPQRARARRTAAGGEAAAPSRSASSSPAATPNS